MKSRLDSLGKCSVRGVQESQGITVKPGYTGHKKFVWAGQEKFPYKENSGILAPDLIQIIPAQIC